MAPKRGVSAVVTQFEGYWFSSQARAFLLHSGAVASGFGLLAWGLSV